jgi:hypothetical protein
MEFISTKGMTHDTAPEGQVLVQYLEPSWGYWSVEFAIGYYDNPNDYTDGNGEGWKHWTTENQINVIAYAILPEKIETELTKMTQPNFQKRFGSYHPNFGNIGE